MRTQIAAPVALCFDLSRDIDLHLRSMVASGERAAGGLTSGLIGLGEEVTWEARHFGWRWRMTSRITELDPPRAFVDEMRRGPFVRFRHEHAFTATVSGTLMIDVVDYRLPLRVLGGLANLLLVRRHIQELTASRNRHIKQVAESLGSSTAEGQVDL